MTRNSNQNALRRAKLSNWYRTRYLQNGGCLLYHLSHPASYWKADTHAYYLANAKPFIIRET